MAPIAPNHLVTCDASKVSPRAWADAFTGDTPAKREARRLEDKQRCIRAIRRGDVWGFPQALVAECEKLMQEQAEEDAGWALAERCALGMVK